MIPSDVMSSVMENKVNSDKSLFSYRWYESLHTRLGAFFLLFFLFTTLFIFLILKSFGDKIIEEEAYLHLNQANSRVIAELERHAVLSATLVQAIANLTESLPYEQQLYRSLIPKLINHKGAESYIAGGGVWPAPYQFVKDKEKHSLFWARDQFKGFIFHDSYNLEGNGYHAQEWYVPATHLGENAVYWSKSYIDPCSLEPMVTVSAPLIRDQKNIGVATINLKLYGLHQLLENITRSFDGYAFALDRNGTFLSYPSLDAVISTKKAGNSDTLQSFISYQELSKALPAFAQFKTILDAKDSRTFKKSIQKGNSINQLASQLTAESDQIGVEEAQFIASSILYPASHRYNQASDSTNTLIEVDPLLNEAAFVAVSEMPETHWKIITVMPYRTGVDAISLTYLHLTQATLIALLLTTLMVWVFIHYGITSPIAHFVKQIRSDLDSSHEPMAKPRNMASGELRTLHNIFNLQKSQLANSQRDYQRLTHFDPLTALSNRQSLIARLRVETMQGYGALLFINLDNFKRINDSLGHQAGDELLAQLAERFTHCVSNNDIVARLGGDEFVVLIMKSYTYARKLSHDATDVAQTIIDAMQVPIILKGQAHYMTLSIGISTFYQQNEHSDLILHQAGTAMYHAKNKGKNCFCLFNDEMEKDAYRRLEIEEALRLAIKQKELSLVYQPQVDIQGRCFSAEVFVRWTDPNKGTLSPIEFLNVAEEYGLILDLGQWVFEEACAQFSRWSEESINLANISINISSEQFRDINLVSQVRKTIDSYHLQADQLTLEITEKVIIADIKDSIYKINQLKKIGVRLAIDDFGVGDSVLRYLKDLPIEQLKIESSFTHDIVNQPDNAMILKTIIDIAKHLQINLVAKGVEDKQQLDRLIELGCEQFQGFYFSAPQTATELTHYLEKQVK